MEIRSIHTSLTQLNKASLYRTKLSRVESNRILLDATTLHTQERSDADHVMKHDKTGSAALIPSWMRIGL